MKKPVIILISLVYILAIVIVGFIGVKARVFNPKTYVEDIEVSFDPKLTQKTPGPNEATDYKYHIDSGEAVSFYIRASVLPHEATDQLIIFEKRDDTVDFYTIQTELKNGYNTATFVCAPLEYDDIKIISVYLRPTDGNKKLVKKIDIVITNWGM